MQSHGAKPNKRLDALISETGISRKELAKRANEKSFATGRRTAYAHTNIARWIVEIHGRGTTDPAVASCYGCLTEDDTDRKRNLYRIKVG
ncbi:hypothetical protein ACFU7Y_36925 [Kitasatospora sp. NPDC057542]|uniref:hypothetical protein n=1 Tax=Kitasatospora sp. NPDC057542 TaxID=3346162 RepID=UPI0036B388D2